MKLDTKKYTFFLLLFSLWDSSISAMLLDMTKGPDGIEAALQNIEKEEKKERKRSISSTSSELVDFSFQQKNLKDLLNEFAAKLQINILYPETEITPAPPATSFNLVKVSFDAGRKITVTEAWNFIVMFLEQSEYTLVFKGSSTYVLVSKNKAFKESLPLYVGVDFNQLPDSMERIRYIYYFNNIQLSKQSAELQTILTNIISPQDLKDGLVWEPSSNSMILTTRSDMVKTIMQLISVLDESGFSQAVELFKLQHVSVKDVVDLFKLVLGADAAKKSGGFASISGRSKYFSDSVRVENLDPNGTRQYNTLIIMGKSHDIEEIKKFIKKYLDVPQESGKSFFHVVDLQWVQATHFTNVLNSLISGGTTASGQSTGSITSSDLGFDPHIKIQPETITQGSTTSGTAAAAPNNVQRGGNRLVIACNNRDWQRIDALVKQLDIPQKQVVIEALVMDLSVEFVRKLGSQLRTRGLTSSIFPKNMQVQAGLITNSIIQTNTNADLNALTGDLSDILNPGGTPTSGQGISAPISSFGGNTIVMINGGKQLTNGIWGFFQLLSTHNASKVFTRPCLTVLNNQSTTVTSNVTKILSSNVVGSVTPTVNYTEEPASIKITFTPLISDNNTINLQLNFDLTTFTNPDSATDGTKKIRQLQTNVSMKSGDVLILGGLTNDISVVGKRSVPFFDSIPVLGNLFASRTKDATQTRLYILVRPTVISPRIQGGMGALTKAASDFMVDQLAEVENVFANNKDPVTRWFFNNDNDQTASEYLEEKIADLPKFDFGFFGTNEVIHSKEPEVRDMRIGWLSDVPSNNLSASQPATDKDMDNLSKLLKNVENPFIKRTVL